MGILIPPTHFSGGSHIKNYHRTPYGHGSKPRLSPSEHPNPTTQIGSRMGGAPTPKCNPINFDHHSHIRIHRHVTGSSGTWTSSTAPCRRPSRPSTWTSQGPSPSRSSASAPRKEVTGARLTGGPVDQTPWRLPIFALYGHVLVWGGWQRGYRQPEETGVSCFFFYPRAIKATGSLGTLIHYRECPNF